MSFQTSIYQKNRGEISSCMDTIFNNFIYDIEKYIPWNSGLNFGFPTLYKEKEIRKPLFDLIDKGNIYEIQVEMTGIEKKSTTVTKEESKIDVN